MQRTVLSAATTTLWLRSVRQPQISGRFEAVRSANGRAVWRQVDLAHDQQQEGDEATLTTLYGPGWFYNSADNHWFVTVHESCVGETGGILGALEETSSDSLPALWKRWDGPERGWNESVPNNEVQWTTSLDIGREWEEELKRKVQERQEAWPNQVLVEEQNKNDDFAIPEELLGIYSMVNKKSCSLSSPSIFCGQPVWKNSFGSRLFSDAFGFWRIAKASDDLVNAGPPGYVQSQDIVAALQGLPPTNSDIVWMVDGGGCGCGSEEDEDDTPVQEWKVNPRLKVTAVPATSTADT